MKRPSQKTWELIRELYADQSLWEKLIHHQDPPVRTFDEIASSDEALAIPHLTTFLLNGRLEVREAAARAIGRLVATVPSSEFVQLDEAFRSNWGYESTAASAWLHLKPKDLKEFWRLPNAVSVIGVASCHGSGFIRDAAVNELEKSLDGSELPFLLVRLNDWVGVVRESATTAVLHRIRRDYATHFLRHLRLVFRLRSCGRSQHERIVSAVTALFQEPGSAPVLRQGLLSSDRWIRRESLRMAITAKSSQSTVLLKEMLSEADPIMRLWAARNILSSLDDAELMPLLSVLVHDRFMPVRCEALNILVQRSHANARKALDDALLDNHLSVRSLARHWIRIQQPEFNFASVYRQSLDVRSARRQRSAILGLGETGKPSDAEATITFLNAPLVSTRKAAIRTLAALDGDRYVTQFITALTDEHPGLSNEATRALVTRKGVSTEQLQLLFRTESLPHVRKNIFKLLTNQSFWARGVFLFEALRDQDEYIVELGRRAFRDWLTNTRRMAAAPAASEVQQLRNALKASSGMLTPSEVREFEFCLKSYE